MVLKRFGSEPALNALMPNNHQNNFFLDFIKATDSVQINFGRTNGVLGSNIALAPCRPSIMSDRATKWVVL